MKAEVETIEIKKEEFKVAKLDIPFDQISSEMLVGEFVKFNDTTYIITEVIRKLYGELRVYLKLLEVKQKIQENYFMQIAKTEYKETK